MKYRQPARNYGTIRSRSSNLTSEQNQSSRHREDYQSPGPYIPLDARFYRYAGIEHPTITLDPQAYVGRSQEMYFKKTANRGREVELEDESSSEFEQFQMNSSDSSEDVECYAHQKRGTGRSGYQGHQKGYSEEIDSSFELSPYEGNSSQGQEEEDSFRKQKMENKSRREKEYREYRKKISKVEQESEDLDYSGDSEALRLKEEQENHRRSINKIEKARNIVKEKLRTQQFERRLKSQAEEQSDDEKEQKEMYEDDNQSQFVQSARFPDNLEMFKKQKTQNNQSGKISNKIQSDKNIQSIKHKIKKEKKKEKQLSPSSEEENDEQGQASTFRIKESPEVKKEKHHKEQKKEKSYVDVETKQRLIPKHELKEFYKDPSPPKPILRKPKNSKSQKQIYDQSYNQQEISNQQNIQRNQQYVKQNNNPEIRRTDKVKKSKKEIPKPVAFEIDNYRQDLTLAQAFKIHCSDLRHKLKEEREQFKGQHQHERKARLQNKRNISKTRTFMRNKFKTTTRYPEPFESEARFTSPFTGRNNPFQQFKRMDVLRRRQLMKKYDKATRLRLAY